MLRTATTILALTLAIAGPARADVGVTLRGSPGSMERQHRVAEKHDYTFLRTPAQVREFAEEGRLVRVEGNADYRTAKVSFPYARPELLTFVERLAAQYREGCGEKLVVTSLTRPRSLQPRNAHPLSVHPTGMAVDLRVSESARCRRWLESVLLKLEAGGLLDVTRERRPPHYHVAVFPEAYREHVAALAAEEAADRPAEPGGDARVDAAPAEAAPVPASAPYAAALAASPVSAPDGGRRTWPAVLVVAALYAGLGVGLRRVRAARAGADG